MNPSPVTKKSIILVVAFSLTIIFSIIIFQINDRRTKIVFCDVGQGDGAYIRIKNKVDVVIDAGPDRKILNCLGKYMPFWDRKIELAFLSHHDKDHSNGFFYITDRYQINKFFTINYQFDTKTYQQLENKIKNKKISYQHLYQGDKISVLDDDFITYWPTKDLKSYDSNDYSLVFLFQEDSFKALFTGDASPKVLNEISRLAEPALSEVEGLARNDIGGVNILKIPHHGSKTGLTKNLLWLISPKIGVISVGKNNPYGHPTKEILELLEAYKVKVKRTDKDGDVVFNLKE